MQLKTAWRSGSVRGAGRCTDEMVWPPVVNVSVICGTVPVSCSACSDSPGTADCTPATDVTVRTACCGKVISVPGTKKSCVNFVPAGPSFDRSVSTEELALRSAAWSLSFNCCSASAPGPPPGPAKNPPPGPRPPPGTWSADGDGLGDALEAFDSAPTVRVTMMSVPTLERGEST